MKQYFQGFNKEVSIRHQPWTESERTGAQGFDSGQKTEQVFNEKYYDFKLHPELIRVGLEDFKLFDQYQSVQNFYDLLEWLNSKESPFETNDSALGKIKENKQRDLADKDLSLAGRLMLFYRNPALNISPESKVAYYRGLTNLNPQEPDFTVSPQIELLVNFLLREFDQYYPNADTCIGIQLFAVLYELALGKLDEKLGHELCMNFWAWGNTEEEVMENFGLIVSTIKQSINSAIKTIMEKK